MVRFFKRLVIRLAIVAVVIVLGLGYLGFVPGVSAIFKSNQPADLGTAPDTFDQIRANEKLGQRFVSIDPARPADVIRSAMAKSVDATLTEREVAAHLMQVHPVKELQIKFLTDGSFEAAGQIDTSRIEPYLRAFGFSSVNQIDVLATIDKYVPGNPRFYLKGRGSIVQDAATLQLDEAKIGRLPLAPTAFANGIVSYADTLMKNVPGLNVESIAITNGQAAFVGQVPATLPK